MLLVLLPQGIDLLFQKYLLFDLFLLIFFRSFLAQVPYLLLIHLFIMIQCLNALEVRVHFRLFLMNLFNGFFFLVFLLVFKIWVKPLPFNFFERSIRDRTFWFMDSFYWRLWVWWKVFIRFLYNPLFYECYRYWIERIWAIFYSLYCTNMRRYIVM